MKSHRTSRAFTVIELLVVVSIIALLVGILLPAIGKAREQAQLTISLANLRNLAMAHAAYAAEWNDRQYTAIVDNIGAYGTNTSQAFTSYNISNGSTLEIHDPGNHPPTYLGYGHTFEKNEYRMYAYKNYNNVANMSLTIPIVFGSPNNMRYFGSFRLPNALQFSQYVSSKFYDKTFYAPKDRLPWKAAEPCFESPDQYCVYGEISQALGDTPVWSSYCMSPAGMYNPQVLAHEDENDESFNGFRDPWELPAGFRSPAYSQCSFPALKTHMLEHHWLQGVAADCNPGIDGNYDGCEPYYFNHAWESSPATLFYDGHVETVGVRQTMRADGRVRVQTGNENWGLWSQDVDPWGTDGYLIEFGYDRAATSFHILTTDGIRGRDILGD